MSKRKRRQAAANTQGHSNSEETSAAEPIAPNSFTSSLKSAVRNPLVGIVSSVLVSVLIYLVSIYDFRPKYTVSPSEVIASKSVDVQGIHILFGAQEVDRVNRVTVVVWNAGDKPIDQNALTDTHPLCLRVPESVQILSERIARTSRPSLGFDLVTPINSSDRCIRIKIKGDDALERNDGLAIELLYAGAQDAPFTVDGRVKGAPSGFEQMTWDRAVKKTKTVNDWIYLGNFAFLTLVGGHMFSLEIRRLRRKQPNNLVLGSFLFFPMTAFGIYLSLPLFVGLAWVR